MTFHTLDGLMNPLKRIIFQHLLRRLSGFFPFGTGLEFSTPFVGGAPRLGSLWQRFQGTGLRHLFQFPFSSFFQSSFSPCLYCWNRLALDLLVTWKMPLFMRHHLFSSFHHLEIHTLRLGCKIRPFNSPGEYVCGVYCGFPPALGNSPFLLYSSLPPIQRNWLPMFCWWDKTFAVLFPAYNPSYFSLPFG